MNKLFALAVTLLIGLNSFSQDDPVIMTINGNEITKSEFLQIYLKNNNAPKYDKASLDEYMELFKKFKLKVAEAEARGYDTIPKLVNELAGYRKQLALPYLVDSTQNDNLVREAYFRTKNEVRASHILIKALPSASPEDTLIAYNKLLELKHRIENGEDFATVAASKRGGSEDPSASSNGGDLGFFNAFQMVYPFEDAAYKTNVGEISNPFRTSFGYHIVKVTEKRAARGTIETAHIMVSIPKNSNNDLINNAKIKIDEIYEQLEAGVDFESLVAKFSDDPSSNKKEGVLPTFGTGTTTRMVPSFEDAAFSIKADGEYSKPVRTDYGYHIIKRITWTDVPSFSDMKKNLENKVTKDVRSKTTQDSFIIKLKEEYSYKDKRKGGLKWFKKNLDSTYFAGKYDPSTFKKNKKMFKLDKKKFRQQSYSQYVSLNHRTYSRENVSSALDRHYKVWEKETILQYEESKLSEKHPAFKALITEYHDGILLYEIMSDEVWNKAMKDTSGLKEFHKNNSQDYIWSERIDADIYECYNQLDADNTTKLLVLDTLSSNEIVSKINGDSELKIRKRTGKFEIQKTSFLKNVTLKEGLNKSFSVDGKFFVVKVHETLKSSPKEFSECKGSVTSDYQNYLEKEWLKELDIKHDVVINSQELYSLGK